MPIASKWSFLFATPVALTAVIGPCPPREEWQPQLEEALPALAQDLRWLFAARGLDSGEVPWTDCHWAESLCQRALPANALLLAGGPDGVELPSTPHGIYIMQLLPGVVWLDELPHGALQVPTDTWFEIGGGSLFSAGLVVALAIPGEFSNCHTPQGFMAPFAQTARWAWQELTDVPQLSWGKISLVVLAMNYVTTNIYLAIRRLEETDPLDFVAAKEELKKLRNVGFQDLLLDLRLLSWRFVELSGLSQQRWADQGMREFAERVWEDLSFIVQTTVSLPLSQPLAVAAALAQPISPVPDDVHIGGVRVPAVGIHTEGLSPEDCSQAVRFAGDLQIRHVHVHGTEACHIGAASALRSLESELQPIVSVAVPSASGDVDEDQVNRILQYYGDKVSILVLSAKFAEVAKSHFETDVVVATAADCEQGSSSQASEFCKWSCYTGSVLNVESRIVQLFSRGTMGIPLPCLGDPHIASIADELGVSPAAVLLRYHLQRGYGVLLDMPTNRSELEEALELGINLNYAHMERIREIPTLINKIAGRELEVDIYGLSDIPVPARLAPSVDDAFFDALQWPLASWRDSMCMSASSCSTEASPLAAKCLINNFEGDSGDIWKQPVATAEQEVHISVADIESLSAENIARLKQDYEEAAPTRYVVIDNFLPDALAAAVDQELPARDLCTLLRLCAEKALACNLNPESAREFLVFNSEIEDTPFAQAVHRLVQSDAYLSFLQYLTGYEVRPDSNRLGGTHFEYHAPAYLSIHEDMSSNFESHKERGFDPRSDNRVFRLNSILFIDGVHEDSGHLELWSSVPNSSLPSQPLVRITPRRNRLVLWDTLRVIHGMPWPLKGNQSRRALQWYYTETMETGLPTVASIRFYSLPCDDRVQCYENSKLI